MAWVLDNPTKLDMLLHKETKPKIWMLSYKQYHIQGKRKKKDDTNDDDARIYIRATELNWIKRMRHHNSSFTNRKYSINAEISSYA